MAIASELRLDNRPNFLFQEMWGYVGGCASQVLKNNIGPDGYTYPAGKTLQKDGSLKCLYPHQWLWDTAFMAAWTQDLPQGKNDIQLLLKGQRDDGFIGHIRYDKTAKDYFPPPKIYYPEGEPEGEVISKITQPPNLAYGVWELAKKLPENERREFLREVFPRIMKFHQYIYDNRVVDHNGLMVTIHPWESGDDNSPKWDAVYDNFFSKEIHGNVLKWLTGELKIPYERLDLKLIDPSQRPIKPDYDKYLFLIELYGKMGWDEKKILEKSPFRVADPMTNAILLRSDQALLEMAKFLKESDKTTNRISSWQNTTREGLESLWDEQDGLYYARDLNTNNLLKVETSSSYVPLFSHQIDPTRAETLARKLNDLKENSPFMVPSTSPKDKKFDPKRYWRGPVWPVVNTLIAEGLKFYGYKDIVQQIGESSLQLIMNTLEKYGGFFEYYDPITGEPLGSPLQSWTAAAVLKLIDLLNLISK